jgi:hypothetical protein
MEMHFWFSRIASCRVERATKPPITWTYNAQNAQNAVVDAHPCKYCFM